MESSVERVLRALIRKHKVLMAPFIEAGRIDDDVLLKPFTDGMVISHAPQMITTDFMIPLSRFVTHGSIYLEEEGQEEGTLAEYHYPKYYDIEFVMIVVSKDMDEAWRMMETLESYYRSPGMMEVTFYEEEANEFKLSFPRDMAGPFVDRSVSNESNLMAWEAKGVIRGVPIYDTHKAIAYLSKEFTSTVKENDTEQELTNVTISEEG